MTSLEEQARDFATDLTNTVHAVVGETCAPFVARLLSIQGAERFAVRQRPSTGVALTIDANHAVTLRVHYICTFDGPQRHLRVTTSSFALHYGREASGEPLFHYDYDRNGGDRFRPSLEDVLQVLVDELGVQAQPGWREALKAGRQKWRDTQLRAAVRDNPRAAAETLVEELGYTVVPPQGEHPEGSPDQLLRL